MSLKVQLCPHMGRSPAKPAAHPPGRRAGVVQLTLKPPGANFPFGRGKLDSLAALGKGPDKPMGGQAEGLGRKKRPKDNGWPGKVGNEGVNLYKLRIFGGFMNPHSLLRAS